MDTGPMLVAGGRRGAPRETARAFPLESRAGGDLHCWMRAVRGGGADPLPEAGDIMRWLYRFSESQGCTEGLVNGLLAAEKSALALAERQKAEASRRRSDVALLTREIRFVQGLLDRRDQQFAALQGELNAMQADALWRLVQRVRRARKRLLALFMRRASC